MWLIWANNFFLILLVDLKWTAGPDWLDFCWAGWSLNLCSGPSNYSVSNTPSRLPPSDLAFISRKKGQTTEIFITSKRKLFDSGLSWNGRFLKNSTEIDISSEAQVICFFKFYFKGTQEWEFFWLRFRILYYFIVNFALVLRFCRIFFWLCHYWGRYDYSDKSETKQNRV